MTRTFEGTSVDRIARDLASGEVSRRSALKRLAGLGLGAAAMTPIGIAGALGGGCPDDRVRCDGKCCPKNARCRRGRCRCRTGYTRCGKRCVDTETSVKHCGKCGHACDEAEVCVAGDCTPVATCGNGQIEPGEECDGNNHGGETCITMGFAGGTLTCTSDCQFDTTDCTDTPCGCPPDRCDVSDGCGGTCSCPDPLVCIDTFCELGLPP